MRISALNNQQHYKAPQFQGKGKSAGYVIGGFTGLLMSGAMIASFPGDWKQIKTWPIVVTALTAGGALEGKMIADFFSKKKDKE